MNKKIKIPLESSEAKALKTWADYHPIAKNHLIHIPNGGSRNLVEAKNLKLQGVKAGVSDYFLSYPTCACHCNCGGAYGLWIELKRCDKKMSRLTYEQAEWLASQERVGYVAHVAYGWEDAAKKIEDYLIK